MEAFTAFGNIFSSFIESINMFFFWQSLFVIKIKFLSPKTYFSELYETKMKVEVEIQSSFKAEYNLYHHISLFIQNLTLIVLQYVLGIHPKGEILIQILAASILMNQTEKEFFFDSLLSLWLTY